jgi:hypothetical protein
MAEHHNIAKRKAQGPSLGDPTSNNDVPPDEAIHNPLSLKLSLFIYLGHARITLVRQHRRPMRAKFCSPDDEGRPLRL